MKNLLAILVAGILLLVVGGAAFAGLEGGDTQTGDAAGTSGGHGHHH